MNMEEEVRCLYQIFRPKHDTSIFLPEGWGNCRRCTTDVIHNPECKGYTPVRLTTYEVADK